MDNIRKAEEGEIEHALFLTEAEMEVAIKDYERQISKTSEVVSISRIGDNKVLFRTLAGPVEAFFKKRDDGKILVIL